MTFPSLNLFLNPPISPPGRSNTGELDPSLFI
nr:MAG TPA: hypothetical protein [Caudoviricetes sp.]